jgi:hypothetical protein
MSKENSKKTKLYFNYLMTIITYDLTLNKYNVSSVKYKLTKDQSNVVA